jgi:cell division protein FtsW
MEEGKESSTFSLANSLALHPRLAFMKKPLAKRCLYIYGPSLLICGLVAPGSNSSAIFIAMVLIGTMLIGGIKMKELLIPGVVIVLMALAAAGLHKATDGDFMPRLKTFFSRLDAKYDTENLSELEPNSREFWDAIDDIRQPYGAKIAIHEGGLLGKGSGNSTQKYSVTHIYSDYMFSFLIEEYGLIGGIFIILLYISLIARCSMIARLCGNEFAKIAIGGLAFLITGQAFMHMLVNVDIMPMTVQTLPLISDGASAFLMSCLAFGIILSISRMAKKKVQAMEESMISAPEDDIQERMTILEQIEDNINE